MPKSDAEWRALVEKLAREVMGWHKWDELPENAHRAYWQAIKEEPDEYSLAHNEQQWWSLDESGCPDGEKWLSDWQPHEDVAQALMAARKIVERGWGFQLGTFTYPEPPVLKSTAEFWTYDTLPSEGYAETDAKAICGAIEQWLDAQKEAQEK